jgi:hypothetical protein
VAGNLKVREEQEMNYKLGVWFGEKVVTDQEASELFNKLYREDAVPKGQHPEIYSFYNELGDRYPELEMLSEDEIESSPWACGHDRSGSHVIMCIMSDRVDELTLFIRSLARRHGLICFDAQACHVYLPVQLQPEETWPPAVAATHRLASA